MSAGGPRGAILLDCRWLSIGGPGRTTELLLRGLRQKPPPGRWVLWGPPQSKDFAWDGAEFVPTSVDPRELLGQRSIRDIPDCGFGVFMHQQRPLRAMPSLTLVYDTIALRYEEHCVKRELRRLFLRRVAAVSLGLITISEHSRRSISFDLGVRPERISTVQFPFADAFARRVAELRRTLSRVRVALYVGNFRPHKNLTRLLDAFAMTVFCRQGGRLVLVGGTPREVHSLEAKLTPPQRRFVEMRGTTSQNELDSLFATSLFLVQPSIEEGFGLPAWEALCCGLPVCVSDGGALPEIVQGQAEPFRATSTPDMVRALDACAGQAARRTDAEATSASDRFRETAPTVVEFAGQFQAIIERYR